MGRRERVATHLAAVCSEAVRHGVQPILGLPPPVDGPEELLLQSYRAGIMALGHAVVDFYSPCLDPHTQSIRPGLLRDGVHPTREGCRLIADVLRQSRVVPELVTGRNVLPSRFSR
ncbi:MAG: hypothetical protein AB1445_04245 [Bacillota bacterium]